MYQIMKCDIRHPAVVSRFCSYSVSQPTCAANFPWSFPGPRPASISATPWRSFPLRSGHRPADFVTAFPRITAWAVLEGRASNPFSLDSCRGFEPSSPAGHNESQTIFFGRIRLIDKITQYQCAHSIITMSIESSLPA